MEALKLWMNSCPRYRALFRARLERAVKSLSAVDGIECRMSDATFYLFPRVAGDDAAIAKRWLDEPGRRRAAGLGVRAAGAGHLRFSPTASDEDLDIALERIAKSGIGQK